jgi:hypothetical protein
MPSDFIRGAYSDSPDIKQIIVCEIYYTGGVFVFTEADITAGTVACIINSTGDSITISKGADNDPLFGFVLGISEDGKFASVGVKGIFDATFAAAAEDPDVGDKVTVKGDGKVKQAATLADTGAGARKIGTGFCIRKSSTTCSILL